MSTPLHTHIEELKNTNSITPEEVKIFLKKFEILANTGINSNSIFYILDLSKMTYAYINDVCKVFTGQAPEDFYTKGMTILPEIMNTNDFNVLSTQLFPKMNAVVTELESIDITQVVFELHYHMYNPLSKKNTPIVEYSSYSKLDQQGRPLLSTGMCFESVLDFQGVRGIVRLNTDQGQRTLFDETISHVMEKLTKKEKEITQYLMKGHSRKEVADHMNISYLTVNTHVKRIYKKLNIHKISDLVKLFKSNN